MAIAYIFPRAAQSCYLSNFINFIKKDIAMKAKMIRTALASAAIIGTCFSASAFADIALTNWQFGGAAPSVTGIYQLNFTGESYITTQATSATTFNFQDTGIAYISGVNAGPNPYSGQIGFTFSAQGSGTYGGSFTFTGGTTNFYYSTTGTYPANVASGTYLGGFYVSNTGDYNTSGGAGLDINAIPTNNTHVTVTHNPALNGPAPDGINGVGGSPLNTWLNGLGVALDPTTTIGYITTNASLDLSYNSTTSTGTPNTLTASQLAMESALGAPSGTYNDPLGSHFFVTNGGQFKLSTVPVPGSLLLMGLGLTVLGFVVSRGNVKRSSRFDLT